MGKALLINPVTGEGYLLENSVVLGCDRSCSIPFADWDMAPVHASINKVGEEWHLSDLGAPNGVYLDYKRLSPMGTVPLPEGSCIRMGNTELFFTQDPAEIRRYEQPIPAAAAPAVQAAPVQADEGECVTTTAEDALAAVQAAPVAPAPAPLASAPVTPAPVQAPSREKRPEKKPKEKKKKNRKLIAALVSVAAVAVLILGWCGIFHLQGNSRMSAGDYPAAMESYQKDFLFGGGSYREAARLAGERAFSQENYEAAAMYFQRAGSADRRADSIYEWGRQLIAEGRPEEAIQTLQQIGSESRAVEQIDVAKLAIAQRKLDEGDYQGAIDMAMSMENLSSAYPAELLDACYRGLAEEAMAEGDYALALEHYRSCVQDPVAATNAGALSALLNDDLAGGAMLAWTALEEGQTDLSREQWQDILNAVSGEEAPSRLEDRVRWEAARAILAELPEFGGEDYMEALGSAVYLKNGVGSYSSSSSDRFRVSSYADLREKCGSDPQGKILVVGVRRDYPGKTESCAILFDVMRLLPKERIPLSLDEVEFLVVVSYDYSKYGSYTAGTAALLENGRVTVTRLPREQQIYVGTGVQGGYAPQTITYFGFAPDWASGGAPDMTKEVYQALKKAVEMP